MSGSDLTPRQWWDASSPRLLSGDPIPMHSTRIRMTPCHAVRIANHLADEFSKEPRLRALAVDITRTVPQLLTGAPLRIAEWIRDNITYSQESGEILQGPYTTLQTRTGDCDDLVILWACLCRSIGLPAHLMGVGQRGRKDFYHAMGECSGRVYEITDDRRYRPNGAMAAAAPAILVRLPPRSWGYYWMPQLRRPVMLGMAGPSLASITEGLGQLGPAFAGNALDGVPAGKAIAAAAGQVAGAAGAAASAAATAASLGVASAAVPIVGWVVGGAALLAVGIKALVKVVKRRRSLLDMGNDVKAYIAAIVRILDTPPELVPQLRARLAELLPRMSGTEGEKRKGKKHKARLRIATLDDIDPSGNVFWADGTQSRRQGVRSVLGAKEAAVVAMRSHRVAAKTLADGFAVLNPAQRRDALGLALDSFFGSDGRRGLESIAPSRASVIAKYTTPKEQKPAQTSPRRSPQKPVTTSARNAPQRASSVRQRIATVTQQRSISPSASQRAGLDGRRLPAAATTRTEQAEQPAPSSGSSWILPLIIAGGAAALWISENK